VINVVLLLFGSIAGFAGARRLRRPENAAQAASVARSVSGTLGRRKGLNAPELQRACFSEMVRHVQVTRQGRTHAPARYRIDLHPDDLAVVDESRRWFTDGLVDALRQASRDNGWALDGTVVIDFQADPSRHPGVPVAFAVPPEEPNSSAPVAAPPAPKPARAAPRALALVRADTDERIPLGDAPLTIGRSRNQDITIDDSRVSRSHARIERHQDGWTVVDEGSGNGTRLDGAALKPSQPRRLRDGSVIGIGPVDLRVVTITSTPAAQPGTRALDDSDRTRISGQVLPADRRPES